MHDLLNSLTLANPFVQNTLFAFATLGLGLLGLVLGQREATSGKLCIVIGLAVGLFTMFLLTTPYAFIAPGWCGVFIACFLLSGKLTWLICGSAGNGKAK